MSLIAVSCSILQLLKQYVTTSQKQQGGYKWLEVKINQQLNLAVAPWTGKLISLIPVSAGVKW